MGAMCFLWMTLQITPIVLSATCDTSKGCKVKPLDNAWMLGFSCGTVFMALLMLIIAGVSYARKLRCVIE